MVFEKLLSLRFVSNGTQEFSSSNIEVSIRLKNHKTYPGGYGCTRRFKLRS